MTSDVNVDEVKNYVAECTHRQQYNVRSSFPIKKRKYAHEAKKEGENKQVQNNLLCTVLVEFPLNRMEWFIPLRLSCRGLVQEKGSTPREVTALVEGETYLQNVIIIITQYSTGVRRGADVRMMKQTEKGTDIRKSGILQAQNVGMKQTTEYYRTQTPGILHVPNLSK